MVADIIRSHMHHYASSKGIREGAPPEHLPRGSQVLYLANVIGSYDVGAITPHNQDKKAGAVQNRMSFYFCCCKIAALVIFLKRKKKMKAVDVHLHLGKHKNRRVDKESGKCSATRDFPSVARSCVILTPSVKRSSELETKAVVHWHHFLYFVFFFFFS